MTIMDLGTIIKEIRTKKLKVSQGKFGAAVDATQMMISRLESGQGCTLELFLRICDFLKTKKINLHNIFALSGINTKHIDMFIDATTEDRIDDTNEQRKEQIQLLLKEMEISHNEDVDRIWQLVSSI